VQQRPPHGFSPPLSLGVDYKNGVLSSDHVYMFAEIPPHIAVGEFVKVAKGRSSHRIMKTTSRWSEEHSLECFAASSLDFNLPAGSR